MFFENRLRKELKTQEKASGKGMPMPFPNAGFFVAPTIVPLPTRTRTYREEAYMFKENIKKKKIEAEVLKYHSERVKWATTATTDPSFHQKFLMEIKEKKKSLRYVGKHVWWELIDEPFIPTKWIRQYRDQTPYPLMTESLPAASADISLYHSLWSFLGHSHSLIIMSVIFYITAQCVIFLFWHAVLWLLTLLWPVKVPEGVQYVKEPICKPLMPDAWIKAYRARTPFPFGDLRQSPVVHEYVQETASSRRMRQFPEFPVPTKVEKAPFAD